MKHYSQRRRIPDQDLSHVPEKGLSHVPEKGLSQSPDKGLSQSKAAGQPLEPQTRALLEPKFGHNFADVRVHADNQADALAHREHAYAFAYGEDLFFRQGAYDPTSHQGLYTLAHELSHVIQQRGTPHDAGQPLADAGTGSELEAHTAARSVLAGGQAQLQAGSAGQAQIARIDENEAPSNELLMAISSLPPTMDPPPASPDQLLSPLQNNPLNPSIPRPPGLPTGGTGTRAGPGYDPFLEQTQLETEIANSEARLAEEAARIGTADTVPAAAAEETAALGTAETLPAAAAAEETAVVGGAEVLGGAEAAAAGAEGGALGGIGAGIGALAAPLLAGLGTLLWSNKTAPRWMDELNPLTGQPYSSEQEYQVVQQELRRRSQTETSPTE